jgi:Domain of unknown function (DUF4112)
VSALAGSKAPPRSPSRDRTPSPSVVALRDPIRTARFAAAERRIAVMSRVLDNLVAIPGTGQRVGLDPVIGLIPFVGDVVSAAASFWIIAEAARFRIPGLVLARMVVYASVDLLLGVIPFVGDLFDVFSKANERNLALFRRYATDPGAGTADTRLFFLGLASLFIGLIWLTAQAVGWLFSIVIPVPV